MYGLFNIAKIKKNILIPITLSTSANAYTKGAVHKVQTEL